MKVKGTSSHGELENVEILEQVKNDVLLPVKPIFIKNLTKVPERKLSGRAGQLKSEVKLMDPVHCTGSINSRCETYGLTPSLKSTCDFF